MARQKKEKTYIIYGKYDNEDKEPLDTAIGEQSAQSLVEKYRRINGLGWRIWYE